MYKNRSVYINYDYFRFVALKNHFYKHEIETTDKKT